MSTSSQATTPSSNKRTSIMDYMTETPANEEFNKLKEFLDLIKQNGIENLNEEKIKTNLKTAFESIVSFTSSNNLTIKKSEMAMKILEQLHEDKVSSPQFSEKLAVLIATNLDKTFLEKLLKSFQSNKPENVLKIVKLLIDLLGKILHHNLSLINPLLQVMELAFKHNSADVKATSYECWSSLIRNFALDKEFFFKPKKFSLLLMPLLNKCKSYKEEEVCKSKCLAWLCLNQNVNERAPEHFAKVLMPFLSYCFGISSDMQQKESEDDEQPNRSAKSKKPALIVASEHNFDELTQIGVEFMISFIFNGDLKWLSDESSKRFVHIDLNRTYMVKYTLSENAFWTNLLKYFFNFYATKSNIVNDGFLVYESWRRLCDLFYLNYKQGDDTFESFVSNEEHLDKEHLVYPNNELIEYFLLNSIKLIKNYSLTAKANINETKCIQKIAKLLIHVLESEYGKSLFNSSYDFKLEMIKFLEKSANLLLSADEEDANVHFQNMTSLIQLIESHSSIIDLCKWLHVSNKFGEYLKILKTKTNEIRLSETTHDAVQNVLMFPFKHFDKMEFQENDIKFVLSSLSTICKSFTSLIKQGRVTLTEKLEKSAKSNEFSNVNSWCSRTFTNLKQRIESNLSTLDSSHFNQSFDYLIKFFNLESQFTHFLIQNVFEFDVLNQQQQQQSHESSNESTSFQSSSIIEKLNKKMDLYSNSVVSSFAQLVQHETKFFYQIICSCKQEQSHGDIKRKDDIELKTGAENKHSIQVFCNFIETLSALFTRIKFNELSARILIDLAESIEYLTELNFMSKANNEKHGRLVQFLHTRRSSELFDTFSMQIASYIQNNLNKTYMQNEFDSSLLSKLEPIFYSFLKYSTKANLKQKTIQAWNSTFGKSAAIRYPKRIEKLFIELKEENTNGLVSIYLPGLQPIDLQTTTDMNEEKENTPENTLSSHSESKLKTFLNNESTSSSVPMAQLVNTQKRASIISATSTHTTSLANSTNNNSSTTNYTNESSSVHTAMSTSNKNNNAIVNNNNINNVVNFVFSPVRNSFLNTFGSSLSASKATKTPETIVPKLSPRSVRQSKRKLDLNFLIDHAPDKEFVEINNKTNCNLFNKFNSTKQKQPLTEHQKEMRKQKSFIPMEMQSISNAQLETDSCTNTMMDEDSTTQTIFNENKANNMSKLNKSSSNGEPMLSDLNDENAKMDLDDMNMSTDKVKIEEQITNASLSTIKFQSKINPKKHIELVELGKVNQVELIIEEKPQIVNDPIPTLPTNMDTPSTKRRSARLKSKSVEEETQDIVVDASSSQSTSIPTQNATQSENIENISQLAENIVDSIESKIDEEKKEPSKKFKVPKLNIANLKNNGVKQTTTRKFYVQKLNKITKVTKKPKPLNKKRKLKYKKILESLEDHNKELFKNSDELEKIKETPKKQVEEESHEMKDEQAIEQSVVNPVVVVQDTSKHETPTRNRRVTYVEDENNKSFVDMEDLSDSDEDDEPLVKLVEIIKNSQTETVIEDLKPKVLFTLNEESNSSNKPASIELKEQQQSPPSTPLIHEENKQEPKSLINPIIQRMNGTPTTSILKKRTSIAGSCGKNINKELNAECDSNNTPNKRRVSFCESVQIEEIEPNPAKSLFNRSTPRIQNRAKLVLSPYFNKPNSSPISTNTNTNSPAANSLLNQTADTVTKLTNSPLLTSNNPKFAASTNVSNSVLNSVLPQKTNSSRLTDSLLSPSLNSNLMNNSNQTASFTVPSSPSSSLIDFFSNNKQTFLNQRSSIIHQKMLQQQQNQLTKIPENNLNSPQSQGNHISRLRTLDNSNSISFNLESPKNESKIETTKSEPLSQTPVLSNSEKRKSLLEEKDQLLTIECVYPKHKSSKIPIDTLFYEVDSNEYLSKTGTLQFFKSKSILTIGDLCSFTTNELNNLPFKEPKMESFMEMMKKYDERVASLSASINNSSSSSLLANQEQTSNKQQDNSTNSSLSSNNNNNSSSTSTITSCTFLGSVEEEMAKLEKLEDTSCLDTSIECETLSELQQMSAKETSLASEAVKNTTDEVQKEIIDECSDFDTTRMDVELSHEKNSSMTQDNSETNTISTENMLDTLKEHLFKTNNKKIGLIGDLDLDQLEECEDYLDDIEMRLIELKRKIKERRHSIKNKTK